MIFQSVSEADLYCVEGGMDLLAPAIAAAVLRSVVGSVSIVTTNVNTVSVNGNGNVTLIINGGCGK